MPTKEELARKQAKSQVRDSRGHFLKSSGATLSSKIPASPAGGQNPTSKLIPEFEKPIVALSITNPFRKIMYWLDQIRRHQTTTLAFKLSIPLIVVPVIIAAAFSVGRISGIGIYQSQSQPVAYSSPNPPTGGPIAISRAGILKVAKSTTTTQYLLSLKNGDIVILDVLYPDALGRAQTIDLTKYANKQILVTGLYNKTTNTLKVSDIAEITIFNTTVVPQQSTPSAN